MARHPVFDRDPAPIPRDKRPDDEEAETLTAPPGHAPFKPREKPLLHRIRHPLAGILDRDQHLAVPLLDPDGDDDTGAAMFDGVPDEVCKDGRQEAIRPHVDLMTGIPDGCATESGDLLPDDRIEVHRHKPRLLLGPPDGGDVLEDLGAPADAGMQLLCVGLQVAFRHTNQEVGVHARDVVCVPDVVGQYVEVDVGGIAGSFEFLALPDEVFGAALESILCPPAVDEIRRLARQEVDCTQFACRGLVRPAPVRGEHAEQGAGTRVERRGLHGADAGLHEYVPVGAAGQELAVPDIRYNNALPGGERFSAGALGTGAHPLPEPCGLFGEPAVAEELEFSRGPAVYIEHLDAREVGGEDRHRGIEDLLVERLDPVGLDQLRTDLLEVACSVQLRREGPFALQYLFFRQLPPGDVAGVHYVAPDGRLIQEVVDGQVEIQPVLPAVPNPDFEGDLPARVGGGTLQGIPGRRQVVGMHKLEDAPPDEVFGRIPADRSHRGARIRYDPSLIKDEDDV
ncbi:MAG: hypothetical protein BWX50_01005 [Euryarchaeota archaeon ADurb.Bin009]|nr:MAG: hypothetical protein BWX50_01005 [Euryarchaeota archaeon ADurb.Bin009]